MNKRAKEFLECMGNGIPIHQCEEENDWIDRELLLDIDNDEIVEVKNA